MSFFSRFKTSSIITGTGVYFLGCYGAYWYTTNFMLTKEQSKKLDLTKPISLPSSKDSGKNSSHSILTTDKNSNSVNSLHEISSNTISSINQQKQTRYGISEEERLKLFDDGAFAYDDDIGTDEIVMGLTLVRRWLVYGIKGQILEVGAGTARNLDYYDPSVDLVLIDACPRMVQRAEYKANDRILKAAKSFEKINNEQGGSNEGKGATLIMQMDAASLKFKSKVFDAVVDTFGLCSYEDPVHVINEMSRVCKDDGYILLMEHGKSSYDWLNKLLDQNAEKHIKRWGCEWNKDIENILAQADVDIIKFYRIHFGTTYIIVARPKAKKK